MRQPTGIAGVLMWTASLLFAATTVSHAAAGGVPGQIDQVQQQVTTLQGQVQSLQSSNSSLSASVSSLQAQVQTIQSTDSALATALTSAIAALAAQISQLQTTLSSVGRPGQALWTYYETTEPFTVCGTPDADPDGCDAGGNGDNIIRLINPNGGANANLAGVKEHTVCAMIYVFDDDQEMGECCGCPVSSAGFATLSVSQYLTHNWAILGGPEGGEHSNGPIAIIAAAQNPNLIGSGPNNCASSQTRACNQGCDPTFQPGYSVTADNSLVGTITHNQEVQGDLAPMTTGLTEVNLSDTGPGDPVNLVYLQEQCGAIVGTGTGGGICSCPVE